jgi:hypothetical protein
LGFCYLTHAKICGSFFAQYKNNQFWTTGEFFKIEVVLFFEIILCLHITAFKLVLKYNLIQLFTKFLLCIYFLSSHPFFNCNNMFVLAKTRINNSNNNNNFYNIFFIVKLKKKRLLSIFL